MYLSHKTLIFEIRIDEAIEKEGPNCDLNFIDVSHVKIMRWMFENSKFTGDISRWNIAYEANNVRV